MTLVHSLFKLLYIRRLANQAVAKKPPLGLTEGRLLRL
jgi:hypothetical protein